MNDIINKVEIEFFDLYEYTKKYFKNPDIFHQGILNKNLYENDYEKSIMDRIYFDEQIYKNHENRCVEFGHYIIGILFGNKFIEFKTTTIKYYLFIKNEIYYPLFNKLFLHNSQYNNLLIKSDIDEKIIYICYKNKNRCLGDYGYVNAIHSNYYFIFNSGYFICGNNNYKNAETNSLHYFNKNKYFVIRYTLLYYVKFIQKRFRFLIWKKKIKSINNELKLLPPNNNFNGGIDYLEAVERFNVEKNKINANFY